MSDPAGDGEACAPRGTPPPEAAVVALERTLSTLAYLLTRARAHERSASLAGVSTGRSELYLLMALERGGGTSRVGDLAALLMVEPSHVTRQIDRMQARHLVTRTRDAADGRAREVAITPLGAAALSSLREASRAGLSKALEGVGEDDIAATIRVLTRLAECYAPLKAQPFGETEAPHGDAP